MGMFLLSGHVLPRQEESEIYRTFSLMKMDTHLGDFQL